MGELIGLHQFKPGRDHLPERSDGRWYFLDYRGDMKDVDPLKTYPHPVYVQRERLSQRSDAEAAAQRSVAIRRWINRHVDGPVIHVYKSMTYYRVYNMSQPKEKRHKSAIEHGYYMFLFEQENDAFAFRMAFDFTETTMNPMHPEYGPYPDAADFEDAWKANDHVPWRGYI